MASHWHNGSTVRLAEPLLLEVHAALEGNALFCFKLSKERSRVLAAPELAASMLSPLPFTTCITIRMELSRNRPAIWSDTGEWSQVFRSGGLQGRQTASHTLSDRLQITSVLQNNKSILCVTEIFAPPPPSPNL